MRIGLIVLTPTQLIKGTLDGKPHELTVFAYTKREGRFGGTHKKPNNYMTVTMKKATPTRPHLLFLTAQST